MKGYKFTIGETVILIKRKNGRVFKGSLIYCSHMRDGKYIIEILGDDFDKNSKSIKFHFVIKPQLNEEHGGTVSDVTDLCTDTNFDILFGDESRLDVYLSRFYRIYSNIRNFATDHGYSLERTLLSESKLSNNGYTSEEEE